MTSFSDNCPDTIRYTGCPKRHAPSNFHHDNHLISARVQLKSLMIVSKS